MALCSIKSQLATMHYSLCMGFDSAVCMSHVHGIPVHISSHYSMSSRGLYYIWLYKGYYSNHSHMIAITVALHTLHCNNCNACYKLL